MLELIKDLFAFFLLLFYRTPPAIEKKNSIHNLTFVSIRKSFRSLIAFLNYASKPIYLSWEFSRLFDGKHEFATETNYLFPIYSPTARTLSVTPRHRWLSELEEKWDNLQNKNSHSRSLTFINVLKRTQLFERQLLCFHRIILPALTENMEKKSYVSFASTRYFVIRVFRVFKRHRMINNSRSLRICNRLWSINDDKHVNFVHVSVETRSGKINLTYLFSEWSCVKIFRKIIRFYWWYCHKASIFGLKNLIIAENFFVRDL